MNPLPREMTLVIHREDGMLWTEVPGLPGCFASGQDIPELQEALEEAISMYLAETPEQRLAFTVQLTPAAEAKNIPVRMQLAAA